MKQIIWEIAIVHEIKKRLGSILQIARYELIHSSRWNICKGYASHLCVQCGVIRVNRVQSAKLGLVPILFFEKWAWEKIEQVHNRGDKNGIWYDI